MPGAPVEMFPDNDSPEHARFNDFDYDPESGFRCPFAAHTRKVGPRKDTKNVDKFNIMRRGLPYGPEHDPATEPKTTQDRGLMFVCYQSSIQNGFSFIKNSKPSLASKILHQAADSIFKSGPTRITFRKRRRRSQVALFQDKIP